MTVACTKCPASGSDKIKKVRRKWTDAFHGDVFDPTTEFHECPACGEKVYDWDAMRGIEVRSPTFAKAHIS